MEAGGDIGQGQGQGAQSSQVKFILPISKEASPASILGRIWCDVSSRTCLAGLNAIPRPPQVEVRLKELSEVALKKVSTGGRLEETLHQPTRDGFERRGLKWHLPTPFRGRLL
jgi:hypothetical protein